MEYIKERIKTIIIIAVIICSIVIGEKIIDRYKPPISPEKIKEKEYHRCVDYMAVNDRDIGDCNNEIVK